MVSINYSSREVCCKIVYYGPGLSGKTTNLQYVHAKVPKTTRGDLISLATEADRTLYFDFLPINIGTINGFAAKFQLYTVPGQVYYNATRKLVLRGVDGVVFVADSQPDKMEENIESLTNLQDNLEEYGYNVHELPMVIQYNKRDLPGVLPVEELNARLNQDGWPHFEASATIGNGVFDTLKLIIKLVLDKAKRTSVPKAKPIPSEAVTVGTGSRPTPTETGLGVPAAPVPQAGLDEKAQYQSSTTAVAEETEPAPEPETGPATATTTPASPQTTPEEAPATDDQAGYRPYPGDQQPQGGPKKISPTAFSPAPTQEQEGQAPIEKKAMQAEGSPTASGRAVSLRPTMAPPQKLRTQTRKRGFFKRLFGIK